MEASYYSGLSTGSFHQDLLEEKKALKNAKQEWKEDRNEELMRIFSMKILPDEIEKALNPGVNQRAASTRIVMGRAHEIMELYNRTHFIFAHGKSYYLSLIDDFIKEVRRVTRPETCRSLFKHGRLPGVSSDIKNYQDFYEKFQPDSGQFWDNFNREHLISCDSDLQNKEGGESAYSFFTSNFNIMMRGGDYYIRRILEHDLATTISNRNIRDKLAERVCDFIREKDKIAQQDEGCVGAYYLFCIPKDEVEKEESNFVYLSHEYGKPCDHYNALDNTAEVIEGLQSKRIKKMCTGQVRILAGPLEKSERSRVFRFRLQPKLQSKANKFLFRKLIQEAVLADRSIDALQLNT